MYLLYLYVLFINYKPGEYYFMPIFDFYCKKCSPENNKIIHEVLVNHNCNAICPTCQEEMTKIDTINNTSFILKGKWYKNTKSY